MGMWHQTGNHCLYLPPTACISLLVSASHCPNKLPTHMYGGDVGSKFTSGHWRIETAGQPTMKNSVCKTAKFSATTLVHPLCLRNASQRRHWRASPDKRRTHPSTSQIFQPQVQQIVIQYYSCFNWGLLSLSAIPPATTATHCPNNSQG